MKPQLESIYRKLYSRFGPQHWWPADSAFEVMVGAILTQNTNWQNVERAIANLKKRGDLDFKKLFRLPEKKLALLIKPAGYYNIKARRLKELLKFLDAHCGTDIKQLCRQNTRALRRKLLSVKGVGEETADSILLYALNKPVFVVDAYTKRIFSRHGFIPQDATYEQAQELFMGSLKADAKVFNEYHALIVRLGKEHCLKNKPRCAGCPLEKK